MNSHNPTPKSGPGLPGITRRAALWAIPAIAAPAAAMALPNANADAQLPSENPALLALGEKLPKVEQEYRDARATWDAMWREWSPQWPLAPEACCNFHWLGSEGLERDLSGAALTRPGVDRPAKVMTIEELERRVSWMQEVMAKDDKRKRKASAATRAYWRAEVDQCEIGIELLPG